MTDSGPEDSSLKEARGGVCLKLRRYPRTITLIAVVLALGVALAIFFGVTRTDNSKISGTWQPVLDTPVYSSNNAAQILLAKNGRRLVVIPLPNNDNDNGSNTLKIYDQKNLTMMAAESKASQVVPASWYWHSELPLSAGLAAISEDGLTIAILNQENITILRDNSEGTGDDDGVDVRDNEDGTGRWEQIGQAILPTDVFMEEAADPAMDVTNFGLSTHSSAMVLSEDGSLLTLWLGPDQVGTLVSFRRPDDETSNNINNTNTGKWVRKHRENDMLSSLVHEKGSEQYLAASGDTLAFGLYLGGEDDIIGELMRVYSYEDQTTADNSTTPGQPHSQWSLVDTFVERLGQDFDSFFGQAGAISYDGSVVAVSSPNFRLDTQRFQYGFVAVYQKSTSDRSYTQRGQTIEASPECGLGKLVALSKDGNRMAIYKNCRYDHSVQAYEFQPKGSSGSGTWKKLGDTIDNPREAIHLAMSADGSRMAIVWNDQGTMVYELE